MTRFLVCTLLAMLLCGGALGAPIAPVRVLRVQGQIDPPIADYIKSEIKRAEDDGAQAVLITMDTPGGLVDSTKAIVQSFFASAVPVIVYVSPDGAMAASAGALITMAAHVAAMAPVSNIGSSSPVGISPTGESPKMDDTMKKKAFNALAEYAKSIAERRGRNVKWAESAVREAANLTSTQALKQNVIDHIATDNRDLMTKIDSQKIKVAGGRTVTLRTARAPFEERPMGAWDTFLHYLSNPNVAAVLVLLTMYGFIYELANPGAIFPGVIGAISFILLLYSLSVIPFNAAGLAFIALAILLFAVDLFTPTHGVLTVGGAVSLFFGLMMLFGAAEGFRVSLWLVGVITALTAAFFLFVVSLGVRALKNPYVSGREGVVGHTGDARTDLDPTGRVFVDGSLWTATSVSGPIRAGEAVDVVEMTGLKLKVRKHED
jgi:membrane-bound serine protease (ClpP class)